MDYSELPVIAELEDNAPAYDGSAFMIPVLANDTLVRIQGMLLERYPSFVPADPESFHVTLCYMPGSNGFMPLLKRLDAFLINADSLTAFDTPEGWAVVALVNPNDELFSLQATLHDQARFLNLPLSNYSTPSEYKPHITLGYITADIEPDTSGIDFYYSYVVDGFIISNRDNEETYIDFTYGAKEQKNLLARVLERLKSLFSAKPSVNFDTPSGFKLLNDQYWIAWYTNPYIDRDGEHFSLAAIEADIDYMNATKSYPELWRYHIGSPTQGGNKTRHGFGKYAFMAGKFACVIGVFDNTPIAEKFKAYYKANPDQALSHGFFWFEKDGNVYTKYHTFEISTLPLSVAANPFTVFGSFSEVNKMSEPTDKAIADIRAILGDQMVDQILAGGVKATEKLDAEGVAFKETGETPESDSATDESASAEEKAASDFAPITAVLGIMAKNIEALGVLVASNNSRLEALETASKARQEQEETPTLLHDDRRKGLLLEMEANASADSLEKRKNVSELSPALGLLEGFKSFEDRNKKK